MRHIVLFFFFVAALSGCAPAPSKSDIPGAYIIENDGDREVLKLLPNRTYSNSLFRTGKLVWSDTGKWDFLDGQGDSFTDRYINLDQFRFGVRYKHDDYIKGGMRGYWALPAERTLSGRVWIEIDPDLDRGFMKVASRG